MLLDTLVTCLYTERDPCLRFTCLYTGRDPCIRFACLYTCKEACIRFTYRQRPLFKRDFCLRFTCLYTCRDPSQHLYTHSCNHIHQSTCCLGCRSLLCTHIHLYQKINTLPYSFLSSWEWQQRNKRTYCSWILLHLSFVSSNLSDFNSHFKMKVTQLYANVYFFFRWEYKCNFHYRIALASVKPN